MIEIFPKIASCAASGDIEQLAILCRQYFGGDESKSPKIDIESIFTDMGIQIAEQELDYYGAVAARDAKGRFEIAVAFQKDLPLEEKRFLLAHIFGHVLLEIQTAVATSELSLSGFRETSSPLQRYVTSSYETSRRSLIDEKEQRADQFAAALILPEGMVKRAVEKIKDIDKVAQFFGTTKLCVERRLEELGELSSHPTNFIDAERKLKGQQELHNDLEDKQQPLDLSKLHSPDAAKKAARQTLSQQYSQAVIKADKEGKPTSKPKAAKKPADTKQNALPEEVGKQVDQSLSRIRKLAKRLDDSVPI